MRAAAGNSSLVVGNWRRWVMIGLIWLFIIWDQGIQSCCLLRLGTGPVLCQMWAWGSAGTGSVSVVKDHVLLRGRPPPSLCLQACEGILSAQVFISLVNYRASLWECRLIPGWTFHLPPYASLKKKWICWTQCFCSFFRAQRRLSSQHKHTSKITGCFKVWHKAHRLLCADRLCFLLWESDLTAPLRPYRWRCVLWHCLWPPSHVVVTCTTALQMVSVLWGAELSAGRGVGVMIAFWPQLALHYNHNKACTSSTAVSKC